MSKQFSGVVKNSLFAMVDLFLDYVKRKDVGSQLDNVSEFVIDCHNLEGKEPEFKLIQEKFKEEFEEDEKFNDLEKDELMYVIENAIFRLIKSRDIPTVVLRAINDVYKKES